MRRGTAGGRRAPRPARQRGGATLLALGAPADLGRDAIEDGEPGAEVGEPGDAGGGLEADRIGELVAGGAEGELRERGSLRAP